MPETKRPNFLVFMTDHQRGDTQPPFGFAKTPNLDRLFRNGASFTHAFCPSPHCAPSRATFFSGLYPSGHGVWDNVNVSNAKSRGLFDGVRLFSEDLKDAGYNLFFAGKWHVSDTEGPEKRGFEVIAPSWEKYQPEERRPQMRDWKTYTLGWDMSNPAKPRAEGEIIRPGFHRTVMYGEREINKEDPYGDHQKIEKTIQHIETMPVDKPFFIFVGMYGPHSPYIVPQKYLDLYPIESIRLPGSFNDRMNDKPAMYRRIRERFDQLSETEHLQCLRHYLAYCTYEDHLFGRLLDALEKRGLLSETVVAYNSDHGDYAGAHGLWEKGLPCFKEAYHVNSVIGYGGIPARNAVVDEFVSLADYAPTFLEMAGVQTDRRFAGQSLAGFLRGGKPENWRAEMFTQSNGNENYGIQRAVFDRKFKYVYNAFDYDELYDLENDPHETRNLRGQPGTEGVIRGMWEKLWRFALENRDDISNSYTITAMQPYGPGIIEPGEV